MIEKHGEAVVDFDVVIKKNPKNAHAYFRRAFSLKALKVSIALLFNDLYNSVFYACRDTLKLLKISRKQGLWTQ